MEKTNKRIRLDDYFIKRIASLEARRKYSTASNYRWTLKSFDAFAGHGVWMDQLSRVDLVRYNNNLYDRGLTRNSVSFYNRVLKAVCNRAAEDGYSVDTGIFANLYTGVDKTKKRALPVAVMRKIINYDPDGNPDMALCRDLFLFSFYCRGMSFVDVAFLRPTNLNGEFLTYTRHKTGQFLVIRLESCMREILSHYSGQPYLFPLLTTTNPKEAYQEYIYQMHRQNLRLKELGKRCGAGIPLNSYAARHTWATLTRNLGMPISIISSGLGHSCEKTTRIYLDSIAQIDVDDANKKLQNYLFNPDLK